MRKSAATVMLAYAGEKHRIVRDATTGRVFAIPKDGDPPLPLVRLGPVLDRAYSDAESRVAPPESAGRVIEILGRGSSRSR